MAILTECPICKTKQSNRNRICKCGEDLIKAKRSKRVRYWIDYRIPGGKQRREPVGYSIKEAQDAEGKRRSQRREGRIFEMLPDSKITFKELSDWYLGLDSVKALSSCWLIELSIKKFNLVFGNMVVNDIKPADLEGYQTNRISEGKAPGTIDHEIGKTKTMVFKAFDNDLVGADAIKAFKRVGKVLKPGTDIRTRILSQQEYSSILKNLPIHLKSIFATAYYTGMRRGEILNLKWGNLDLRGRMIRLEASSTKDNEARVIPICKGLYVILNQIPRAIHDDHVFLYRGKPIRDIRTGLKIACEKAEVPYGRFIKNGFVFHDLRHTFNTNMRKSGVPESVIMEITGHSTREMFDRYNTIDEEDVAKAADRFQEFLVGSVNRKL